jgi:hypothetical protein
MAFYETRFGALHTCIGKPHLLELEVEMEQERATLGENASLCNRGDLTLRQGRHRRKQ